MAFGEDEFEYLEETESEVSFEQEALPAIAPTRPVTDSRGSSNELSVDLTEGAIIQEVEEKKEDPNKRASVIFAVKVTTKKEENAFELISDKVQKKGLEVYSITCPHGLRGYVFLEALDRENAEEAVFNLPYVKGIIPKTMDYSEIQSMLEPVAADIKIEKNDIVEIIAEPFKKEKAKVVRVDKAKEEAIVSLLNAVVPIPVTVKLDNLRVIRREELEE